MKSFIEFLGEEVKQPKPKKATEETTGHLPHVGELLYSKNPHHAIQHVAKVHDRFKGKHSQSHKSSLKVDGGMSLVVGRHQDGRHFVSYKKGSQQFETHHEIAATGKEHYVREMSPLLDHAKRMNIQPGHAFQADIVHNTKEHAETSKPNAITYKVPKGKHLVIAAHSQYSVGHGGELKKTTSHPDAKQLEDHNIHAPNLAMGKNVDLSISKERSKKIDAHLKAAKGHMTKETTKFAKDLASGAGGHHSKFKAFVDQYNSHAARTSGHRSVEGARKYVADFMAKKAQSSGSEKSQKALHDSLHKSLSDNEHHFTNLFNAHNHINAAKHHILDEFKGHAHKFDIHTHGGEEHEGIVSTIGEKHQAKLVREGPGGFPEKNEKNAKTRFAPKTVNEEAKSQNKGKAFLLPGKFSPYTIGHHEVARDAAAHAAASGYSHFYHGIGGAAKQTQSDPFTHAQKTKVIRSAHKELAKQHPNMKFSTTKKEQLGPFHQLTHLAKQGHKHITVALAAGHDLKNKIGNWVKKNNGIKDETGKVHRVKVDFHQLGAERQEGEMPRHEVLSKLRGGDIRVAKATRLRNAVKTGDTELAHELMPKHMNKPKYFGMIKSAQSKKMNEAPELDVYIEPGEIKKEPFNVSYLKKKRHTFDSKSFVGHKRMGDIHPKYEMWRHTTELTDDKGNKFHRHQFSIVHKGTRKKVGEIDAVGGKINRKTGEHRAGTDKDLKISYLGINDQHSAKKVGTSLAVAAYKHLHKKGRSIKSDTRQSIGGAHVWDTLRKDPEVKRHVKFHDERDNRAIPAHKLPYGGIWQDNYSASDTTLVLHKKRKKKPAVVSEDIEMADILVKPKSGGLSPRNFEKMVAHKGLKPKRSGKIAKGYTLYTSTDKESPEFQDHHIVHDATGHVAGEVSTRTSGNDHTVIHTDVHGDHTQKAIGKSLAVLAYKHLAKKKGNLHSSSLQSPGGASIWNRLRKDPKMKGQVFHKMRGQAEVPAHDLPDKKIWATDVKGGMSSSNKDIPKPLPPSKHHAAEHENVIGSRLVIRPIKKTKYTSTKTGETK